MKKMKTEEIILEKLNVLHKAFPTITFKYKFDELAECHIIQYGPLEFIGDHGLKEEFNKLYDLFIDEGFEEGVLIVDESSPISITDPLVFLGEVDFSPCSVLAQLKSAITPKSIESNSCGENNFALAA